MNYADFLATKRRVFSGRGVTDATLPGLLHPWQATIVRWALRKGRASIFADCGLGKTFMQIAWAASLPCRTLILAPLCVAEQTVKEAAKLGIAVRYALHQGDAGDAPIVITNYERLDRFTPSAFGAVVLDESSILKAFDGKTRGRLIKAFKDTPYRLCCTATPSPNDIAELGNHAEFLGFCTRPEFLATWFVHDDVGWRMKGHAVTPFYRWLASWAVALRSPADLGYDGAGYTLPELRIHDAVVGEDAPTDGVLFSELALKGVGGRAKVRKATVDARVAEAAQLATAPGQWIVWCGLNAESDAVSGLVDGAVNVQGNDTHAEKSGAVEAFIRGDIRVLVTKPKILGFGMNFQHCHQMVFLGLSDSYETYYQCLRRSWRYGQSSPVDAYVVVSPAERAIVENVRRKEEHANALTGHLLRHVAEFEREELVA
jgi:superfamily II DNA or RNA helicase